MWMKESTFRYLALAGEHLRGLGTLYVCPPYGGCSPESNDLFVAVAVAVCIRTPEQWVSYGDTYIPMHHVCVVPDLTMRRKLEDLLVQVRVSEDTTIASLLDRK